MSTCLDCCSSHGLCSTAPSYSITVRFMYSIMIPCVTRYDPGPFNTIWLYTMTSTLLCIDSPLTSSLNPLDLLEITGFDKHEECALEACPQMMLHTSSSTGIQYLHPRFRFRSISEEKIHPDPANVSFSRPFLLTKPDMSFLLTGHPGPMAR